MGRWGGAEVDPLMSTEATDRKRRIETRRQQQASTLAAYDNEADYARADMSRAETVRADALRAAERFDELGDVNKALLARTEAAKAEVRIRNKRDLIDLIGEQRKRLAKRRPERDEDWN